MRRGATTARLALAVLLTLAVAAPSGAKPGRDAPPPAGADAPPAPAAPATKGAAPADEPGAPPAAAPKHCQLANGAVRVLTLKQKKCRQEKKCACDAPCPACP